MLFYATKDNINHHLSTTHLYDAFDIILVKFAKIIGNVCLIAEF